MVPYTHVWFSSGSNDFATYHCRPTDDQWNEFTANANRALDNILAVAPPGIPIVMLRYPKPGMVLNECVRENLELMSFDEMMVAFDKMNSALESVCKSHPSGRCKYVGTAQFPDGTTERFRTNKTAPDTFDHCTYHRDGMHLNNHGFCHWFSQQQTQEAFGCQPATYDCTKSGTTLPGAPELRDIEGQCTDYVFDPDAVDKFTSQKKVGASIGNLGAGKTDYHFRVNSQSVTPALLDAMRQMEQMANKMAEFIARETDKVLKDHAQSDSPVDKDAVQSLKEDSQSGRPAKGSAKLSDLFRFPEVKRDLQDAHLLLSGSSPLFSGANGTALRGMVELDGRPRWEIFPGFSVTTKEQDAIPSGLVSAPGAAPAQAPTAADHALQPH